MAGMDDKLRVGSARVDTIVMGTSAVLTGVSAFSAALSDRAVCVHETRAVQINEATAKWRLLLSDRAVTKSWGGGVMWSEVGPEPVWDHSGAFRPMLLEELSSKAGDMLTTSENLSKSEMALAETSHRRGNFLWTGALVSGASIILFGADILARNGCDGRNLPQVLWSLSCHE